MIMIMIMIMIMMIMMMIIIILNAWSVHISCVVFRPEVIPTLD